MKVTEQHGNGVAIELRGTRRAVAAILTAWRAAQAPAVPVEPEPEPVPEKNGAQAQVEFAGHRYFEAADIPIVQARTRPTIGFTIREEVGA